MNKVYLKKLVHQETLNVKLQLVQEHLQIAKKELSQKQRYRNNIKLSEQTSAGETWPIEVEKFFLNLKKSGISVKQNQKGTRDSNYEVIITIDPKNMVGSTRTTPYKNKFRFYSDGSVYDFNVSKTIGYVFDGNNINLVSNNPSAVVSSSVPDKVLATIDAKGNFQQKAIATDDDPLASQAAWLDPLQQVMDWLGLIPGFGDAIDAINATLYFVRGRYFEGFLSLIAIIPVAGSVISLSVKSAFKAGAKGLTKAGASGLIKRWWLKGDATAIESLGTSLNKNGYLSIDHMDDISKAFTGFGKDVKNFSGKVKKSYGPGAVSDNLDYAAKRLKQGGEGWDEAVIAMKAAKKSKDVVKKGFSLWRTPKAILNTLTLNLLPRLKKLPFFPEKRLAKMAEATTERFIESTTKRPDRLGFLTKFGGAAQREAVSKAVKKQFSDLSDIKKKKILDVIQSSTKLKNNFIFTADGKLVGINWDKLFKSADGTTEFFTKLGKADPTLSKNLAKKLIDGSMKSENVLWSAYKSDIANKIISSQTAKGIQLQFAKNVDIIYDEMQLAGAGMGFDSPEHLKEFGIVPLTKWVIQSAMPGSYASGAQKLEAIGGLIKGQKEAVEAGLDAYGIDFDDLDQYPPLGADEQTYQEEEK
tara:strand:- start:3958 stop:5883 length:1926 start_codon:yes stop_codon:yes gene_type:complete